MRAALRDADLRGEDIGALQLHGTGTPLGDPIELGSSLPAFARPSDSPPLILGTVKTFCGHAEPAAGVEGLIQALLTLSHGSVAPFLHLRWASAYVQGVCASPSACCLLPREPQGGAPRTSGASSFAFQGTNAHILVNLVGNVGPASQSRLLRSKRASILTVKHPFIVEALASGSSSIVRVHASFHSRPSTFGPLSSGRLNILPPGVVLEAAAAVAFTFQPPEENVSSRCLLLDATFQPTTESSSAPCLEGDVTVNPVDGSLFIMWPASQSESPRFVGHYASHSTGSSITAYSASARRLPSELLAVLESPVDVRTGYQTVGPELLESSLQLARPERGSCESLLAALEACLFFGANGGEGRSINVSVADGCIYAADGAAAFTLVGAAFSGLRAASPALGASPASPPPAATLSEVAGRGSPPSSLSTSREFLSPSSAATLPEVAGPPSRLLDFLRANKLGRWAQELAVLGLGEPEDLVEVTEEDLLMIYSPVIQRRLLLKALRRAL